MSRRGWMLLLAALLSSGCRGLRGRIEMPEIEYADP